MKKKMIISTIIIGLLLTTSIVTVSAFEKTVSFKELKSIKSSDLVVDIFVDDDAPLEWYNETNVKTIHDGVLNATSGNTIFVYSGSYSGDILIDKTVRLVGEDKNTTLIFGSENDYVIRVDADEVEIKGFALGNSGEAGHGIEVRGDNCSVTENIILSNTIGVVALFQSGLIVSKNLIHSNQIGITQLCCDKTYIVYNTIYNNLQGIGLFGLEALENYCFGCMVVFNEITNNQKGIDIKWCEKTTILGNVIENNGVTGIFVKSSIDTKICVNSIKNNGLEPDPLEEELLPAGIVLEDADSDVVLNNIYKNKDFGLKAVNSSVNAKLNYWGALLGPKYGLFSNKISTENSEVNSFPWIPIKIGIAGDF
jgi:nitrous oxidase accessory protein NosD